MGTQYVRAADGHETVKRLLQKKLQLGQKVVHKFPDTCISQYTTVVQRLIRKHASRAYTIKSI